MPQQQTLQPNTLYYGDNLTVLRNQIPDASVDLIYIDPPFSSARNYFVIFKDRTGAASAAQEEAFSDTWTWTEESEATFRELVVACPNQDLATTIRALRAFLKETPMMAYLVSMAIRLFEMHRVLKPTGSFYLHCDPTAAHYLKILLDTIFGPQTFRNEICWKRADAHNDAKKQFAAISDRILFYGKTAASPFTPQYGGFAEQTLKDWYVYLELPDGTVRRMTSAERETQKIPVGARRFNADNLRSPNPRPNLTYDYKGYKPHQNGWAVSLEKMVDLDSRGLLLFPSKLDGRIMRKRYLDEQAGAVIGDTWSDISQLRGNDREKLGYPTQKPLSLLHRIIEASSISSDKMEAV